MSLLIRKLRQQSSFVLKAHGNSMEPVFFDGDVLYYKKILFNKIKTDDIILISKKNKLITHRLIYRNEKFFISKGDSNTFSDGYLLFKKIIGKVCQIKRNGKVFNPEVLYLIQSTQYFQEIIKIKDVFEKEKIDFVFLKGLPLHLYYENNHPRRLYFDCDVLIQKDYFKKAESILLKNGYKKVKTNLSETHNKIKNKEVENAYIKVVNGFQVVFDLHLEVVFMMTQLGRLEALYSQKLIDQSTEEFLKTKREVIINNELFRILSTEYLILYLALHLFHHNFRGAFRYQFLDRIIRKEKLTPIAVKYLTAIIKKYQLQNFVYPVFVLLKKYYQTPIPSSFFGTIKPTGFINFMNFIDFKNLNIFDDESRIKSGITRFKNLFFLSPNPLWKKILVFINLQVIYSLLWIFIQKLKRFFSLLNQKLAR